MDAKRELLLVGAKRKGREQARAAKQKKHRKNVVNKPVKALIEEWQEEMWRVFGMEVQLMAWGPKERSLARLLMKEVGYDTAVKMVHHFIQGWDEAGLPAFAFLWVKRETVLATIRGQVATRRSRIDVDEYDEARDGKQPKIGWG
jgi:hypothetical protein